MTMNGPGGRRQDGFWQRLRRWLFGSREATAAAAYAPRVPLSECVEVGEPLAVPARGEVFDFQVQVEATWWADVPDPASLRERTERHLESVRRAVLGRIWTLGRDHLPHCAGDAEIAMTAMLPSEFCFDDAGVGLRCQVRLQVRPDSRVLEILQPHWKSYLDMDSEHLLGDLRAGQVAALARRWREVLNDQAGVDLGDLVIPYAADLTDARFANVVGALENERRRSRSELAQMLDQAAKNHSRVGLFEFAESYETALEAFKRNMGLSDEILEGSDQP